MHDTNMHNNINNTNKTRTLLQTTRDEDEMNIVFYAENVTDATSRNY